ncbi:hypothetical protein [Paracraurococcus lichenis]|uniref:Uncharacterized protein n=1 Tax=Paracraurococcus lichenis TaxID=3064888 RepID=A0ABT9E0K5_9PROT|nr:hypothetical protein [Paracraurococcus sp. LOR1-02]MDO9709679.1 hypothetical protein [Paracraurococcus sp. LOR1-02]
MRRIGVTAAKATLLGAAVLLGGCSYSRTTGWLDDSSARATDRLADAGAALGAPWGRSRPIPPQDSATIARVTGTAAPLAPLRPEDGDVWPVPEAPRATLANPDAAMRGIPNYRQGELDRPSGPAPRSEWQPTDPGLPPGLRGGASTPPPPPLRQPGFPPPTAAAPVPGTTAPPPARADGRVITTPNGPAITTGGTDRVQSFITPGGGTGTAINDGNTTTLIGPNGQVQSVPSR